MILISEILHTIKIFIHFIFRTTQKNFILFNFNRYRSFCFSFFRSV